MGKPHPASTDSNTIDREHQLQLHLMQALATALDGDGDVDEMLAQLADYSRAHFLSEELLMRLYAYPDYDDHVLDHEKMTEWLDALAARRGDRDAMQGAVSELMTVFRRHIDGRDRKLHDFMAEFMRATVASPVSGRVQAAGSRHFSQDEGVRMTRTMIFSPVPGLFALIVGVAFTLAGCQKNPEPAATADAASPSAEYAAPAARSPGNGLPAHRSRSACP
ncbi:MAG: hemerythrin family protein [Desulfobacterales bacterium]|nr:hemerythrin family protein [Desulfobacterales bacterium]